MTAPNPYWWLMLRALPYFRALLRAVEAGFYQPYQLKTPILDLGAGDGHFASVAFSRPLDVGVDPHLGFLKEAARWGAYRALVDADGARAPFPPAYFGSAVSNSVLEHIPHLDPVLAETARLLKPGAHFLFCVPNHRWPEHLAISGLLARMGLKRLAAAYVRFFTRVSRHLNMLSPDEWRARLARAGFDLEDHWHYFPPSALRALEWGHYLGLPSLVARRLFGRWILVPTRWNLGLTDRLLRRHVASVRHPEGVYTFYVARRRAD